MYVIERTTPTATHHVYIAPWGMVMARPGSGDRAAVYTFKAEAESDLAFIHEHYSVSSRDNQATYQIIEL